MRKSNILVLVIFISFVGSLTCVNWVINQYSLPSNYSAFEKHFDIEVTPHSLCVYDKLNIQWKSLSKYGTDHDISKLAIMISKPGEKTVFAAALSSITNDIALEEKNIISCLKAQSICVPIAKDLVLIPTENKISVEFDQETTSPLLDTTAAVNDALHFVPSIVAASAEWLNSRKLVIILEYQAMETVMSAYQSNLPIKVSVKAQQAKTDLSMLKGEMDFRPVDNGLINVFVVDAQSGGVVSKVHEVDVQICSVEVLPSLNTRDWSKREAIPRFHVKGVIPSNLFEPIKVSSSIIPALSSGSWTISFWIRLLEGPTGLHRSIIYKGIPDKDLLQRTPSAWLMPDSNRITIRVSTEDNPDEGIVSNKDIPLNQWTLITMQFHNHTDDLVRLQQQVSTGDMWTSKHAITPPAFPYSIELYINGALDLSAQYKKPLQHNDGTLWLFKDPSFSGPKAFVHDIIVWESNLRFHDILSRYLRGPNEVVVSPVNLVIEIFEAASNTLLPFIQQRLNDPQRDTSIVVSSNGNLKLSASSSTREKEHPLLDFMNKKSKESISSCEDYYTRLDIHAESAELGSIEGLINWAKLLTFGYEIPESKCGFSLSKEPTVLTKSFEHNSFTDFTQIQDVPVALQDVARGNAAFLVAVEKGYSGALFSFALNLLFGLGLESILSSQPINDIQWQLPYKLQDDSSSASKLKGLLRSHIVHSLKSCNSSEMYEGMGSAGMNVLCMGANAPAKFTDLVNGLFYLSALWNDAEAHTLLSYRYEHGIGGMVKDIETALQYSLIPVRKSHEAYHTVGAQPIVEADRIHENTVNEISKGQQGNDDELIQYQIIRAREGDVGAMLAMGDLYYYGARGMPRDQIQALQYYSQAANLGDASGMCGAANMYLKGEGTELNASKAIELYEHATTNGSIRAYNGLGYLYYYGTAQVPKNSTLAFQYFLMAAQFENDGDALFNTAYCYENGIGTDKSLEKAIYYYSLAAKKVGYFGAVHRLGELTLEGKGLPRSNEQALMYFNAVKSIGPWMGWLRRGFDLFLSSQSTLSMKSYSLTSLISTTVKRNEVVQYHHLYAMKSLMCYLLAGELGFEVAQSNAAFLLRASLIPQISGSVYQQLSKQSPNSSLPKVDQQEEIGTQEAVTTSYVLVRGEILQRILKREYILSSSVHQVMDAYLQLGNCYWFISENLCGIKQQNADIAKFYYQIASHGGKDTMAAAYLGMVHHFGSSSMNSSADEDISIRRALRYYEAALQSSSLSSNQVLYNMIFALKTALVYRSSSAIFQPLSYAIEYTVKELWF